MENQGISLIPEVPNIEAQNANSATFESCLFPNVDCNAVVQEKYWNMYTPLGKPSKKKTKKVDNTTDNPHKLTFVNFFLSFF